jgi:TetR/AcrR family fatty acid metabolism transcriptional regulator
MPRIVDKKEKATRIGSAAVTVFRKLGYHRTRMVDIAEAAGIGKGTLYEYFRNKEEILRFEFERYFAAFESGAAAAMTEADSPGGRLLSLVEFAIDHVKEWEDHCAVYVDYFGSTRLEEAAPFSISNIYAEVEDTIRLLIEEGQACGEIERDLDPGATAEFLVSVFEGVVLYGVFSERRGTPESLRDTALRLITRGVFTGPPKRRRVAKSAEESAERNS